MTNYACKYFIVYVNVYMCVCEGVCVCIMQMWCVNAVYIVTLRSYKHTDHNLRYQPVTRPIMAQQD